MTDPQNDLVRQKPGPKPKAAAPKKGKKSWTPSDLGSVINKEDGFRHRWVRKDEDNIAKKKAEGWEFVSSTNGAQTKGKYPDSRPDEAHPLTSNIERRDSILMRLDNETAEARDDYVNNETARRTSTLRRTVSENLGKTGAPVHGSLSMEKRGERTVIKD